MKRKNILKKYALTCMVVTFCLFVSLKTARGPIPLLPRALFFGNAQALAVSLAPCGTKLALIARLKAGDEASPLTIWLQDSNSGEKRPLLRALTRSVWHYHWSGDGSKILFLQDLNGDENWRLYGVDCKTEEVTCYTPFTDCQVRIVETRSTDPSTIALSLNNRSSGAHDLYALNIETGSLTLLCPNPGTISQWIVNKQLLVKAAVRETYDGGKELVLPSKTVETEWEVLRRYDPEDSEGTVIIDYSEKNNCLYIRESKEYNTQRLISLNLTTRELSTIAQDPSYDITGAYIDPATEEVEAFLCEREKVDWHFLKDGLYKRIYTAVSRAYPGNIEVLNSDAHYKKFIVAVERDTCPISYYLYDDTTHKVQEVCRSRPDLKEDLLCPMQPICLESRDGLTLHGYLSLPHGKTRNAPLVLVVHDGPWRRVKWGYGPITQWLTNRGYGVITINYRGSTGYGKEFMNAGNKEWGGAMQDDLTDTVMWAIEKGIADPQKIAIFGGSYGGYAALMGAVTTPNLFCCAVDIVGITNLVSFLRSIPPYWHLYRARLYRAIGNPDTEQEFLESRSPLFKLDALKIPLFIAQGARDVRVPKKESEQIVAALARKSIPYTYLLFENEGHVFVNAETRLKLYESLEKFLAQTLGGLCEE